MSIFNLEASNIIDLQLKLEGKIPVDRDELLALANSWGRIQGFYTKDKDNNEILINGCEAKEYYDLSNLDVSKISNFDAIFRQSNFDGDISKWNVSNAKSMVYMFYGTKKFNSPLDKWNVSNVTTMKSMFKGAESFNQAILWDLSNNRSCYAMFYEAKAFEYRFNKGKKLPDYSNKINDWLIENRDRMVAIDIEHSKAKELDQFLFDFDVIVSKKLNGLHNVITSTKLNELYKDKLKFE